MLVKSLAFLLPLPLYLILVTLVFPAPNSGFIFLGIIGTFFLGLGLISITGLLDGMYFGNIITSTVFGVGTLLILISSIIMYTPAIYSLIDEQYISFYFLIWLSLIISAIWYVFFRISIPHGLRRRGISKTAIDELKKGTRNYWWYHSIQNIYGIGLSFYLNKLFTILYLGTVVMHLLLGWWRIVSPCIALATCVLCILNVALWGIAYFPHENRNFLKKQNPDLPYHIVVLGLLFPAGVCIAVGMYFLRMQ